MLPAFAILLVFQCLGEGLAYALRLPVPGPVVGMLLLAAALAARPAWQRHVAPAADALLGHLSLLFVPAGVGIVVVARGLQGNWTALAAAIVLCTLLTLAVTALTVRLTARALRGRAGEGLGDD